MAGSRSFFSRSHGGCGVAEVNLANIFISSELARKTRQPSRGESQIASYSLLALLESGTGDQPYSGAADRLIRVYQESRNSFVLMMIMQVDHRKGADFLRGVAATNDIMALYAVRRLCGASFSPELSAAGHESAKAAILDIYDRKLTKYNHSWLTRELAECVRLIRS